MRNDFVSNYLEHSAKGTSWEKQDHKYVARVETADGKIIYFYNQKEYDKYMSGKKKQVSDDLKDTSSLKKEKQAVKKNNTSSLEKKVESGARKIAELFNNLQGEETITITSNLSAPGEKKEIKKKKK